MAYELYLRVYDRSGDLKNGFLPVIWARYTDRVNNADPLIFAVNIETEGAEDLDEFDILEVMIRNKELNLVSSDGGFISAFHGIMRDWILSTDENGVSFVEYTAPGINHILDFRSILFHAGYENRSIFESVAAETIMKTLVSYNTTDLASVANGRYRNGDLLPGMGYDISVGYDDGLGEILSVSFKGGKLLPSLQKVADQAGGDFALTWISDDQYLFEFYPGQLGDDKTTGSERVVFSLENGTMLNPKLIRTGAKSTIALSAGQGQEDLRDTSIVYGPDYASDYDFEMFVDARSEKTEDGRIYRGNLKLDEKRILERLDFEVLQTGNQFYSPIPIDGRQTYKVGDLVLAVYPDEQIRKIEAIQVYWSDPSSEDAFIVDVTTREVVSDGS